MPACLPGIPGPLPPVEETVNGHLQCLIIPAHREETVSLAQLSEWPVGPSVTLKDTQQSFFPQLPTTAYITNT